jgi:hypothetical protein
LFPCTSSPAAPIVFSFRWTKAILVSVVRCDALHLLGSISLSPTATHQLSVYRETLVLAFTTNGRVHKLFLFRNDIRDCLLWYKYIRRLQKHENVHWVDRTDHSVHALHCRVQSAELQLDLHSLCW